MINEAQEWGDFSEWLIRINDCIERETCEHKSKSHEPMSEQLGLRNLVNAIHRWVRLVEEAPVTTWKEELSVRGYDFEYFENETPDIIHRKLWRLLEGLGNMRVYFINTDHLSDNELYRYLLEEVIVKPIAQIPFDDETGCVIDIVGLEVQEDPENWLHYYASNRERMEWAKQNPGRRLPMAMKSPYSRDALLPQP